MEFTAISMPGIDATTAVQILGGLMKLDFFQHSQAAQTGD